MTPIVRQGVGLLAFGTYVALQSILSRYDGPWPWRIVLAAISGAGLLVALRSFAAEVREKR